MAPTSRNTKAKTTPTIGAGSADPAKPTQYDAESTTSSHEELQHKINDIQRRFNRFEELLLQITSNTQPKAEQLSASQSKAAPSAPQSKAAPSAPQSKLNQQLYD